ncbi:MAG: hypothetical protein K5753_03960 [Clostridia bacterium]|nr:hypothetical protein [Clostridia bacterium]
MKEFKTLFRLELKARFGTRGSGNPVLTGLKILSILAFAAVLYTLYIFGIKQLIQLFVLYEMGTEFLVLFLAIAMLILTLFGISSVIKNLFRSGDNELMMRFPVSPTAVFASKISIFVLFQIFFTFVMMLPVLIMFGTETSQHWSYYALLPVVLVFTITLPLSIANLLAIPVMQLTSRTKNMFALTLLVSILLVAFGFGAYMRVVQGVVDYMKEEAMSFFSKSTMKIVSRASEYIYPANWFAYMLIGRWRLGSSLLSLVVVAAFAVGTYFLNKRHYLNTILRDIEGGGVTFTKVTKNRVRRPTTAFFCREYLDIFRSGNYSFQYLCMAVAAPVMVYSCNKLAASMGEDSIGSIIVPALSLMVMLVFCSIILSFAASSVSREGDNFYLTKITPIPYRTQMLVKIGLYMLVSTLSILVTAIVVWVAGQVEAKYAFSSFGIAFLISIALTCFGVRLDTTRPSFAIGGDGELSVGNVSTFVVLFVGFAISVGYGLFGMVGIFMWGEKITFLALAGIAFVLAAASVAYLMIGLDKRYERITQR